MVKERSAGQASRARGGHSRGREWPRMTSVRRVAASLVLAPPPAPPTTCCSVTGPPGYRMGAEQSYRVLDNTYSHTASWTQHTVHSVQHSFRGPGSHLIECGAEFLAIVFVSLYLKVQIVL